MYSECIQNSVASHNAKRKEFREAFSSILQRTPGNWVGSKLDQILTINHSGVCLEVDRVQKKYR